MHFSEAEAAEAARLASTIREMYAAGVPLFTRESIARASRELEAVKNGRQTIELESMKGETVTYEVETGQILQDSTDPDLEYILSEPVIAFKAYEHMIRNAEELGHEDFCAVHVVHGMQRRHRGTKEIANPPTNISLVDTRNQFLEAQRQWKESEAYKELESILKQKLPQADTVVSFALASMSLDERMAHTSQIQHALACTVQDVVQANNPGQTVKGYAQEPIYTPVDEQLLGEVGITVLENPRAFLEVTDSSVVITIAPNIPVKQIVTDLARPAALICNPIIGKTKIGGSMCTDPDSPRVLEMIREYYEEFAFQGDKDVFGNLAVYIRRADKGEDRNSGIMAADDYLPGGLNDRNTNVPG